jgi:hypothetical protein
MKVNQLTILSVAFTLGASMANAQDVYFPIYISQLSAQGTARSMGFGNALGSIGGDFSSSSVNPAGLGVYRSSELSFTPSVKAASSSSEYLGTVTNDNHIRFNVNNFGLVITDAPKGKRYDRRDWKSISFAFGMTRLADINRDYSYIGTNYSSSATLAFEADANEFPGDALSNTSLTVPGYLGYQAYLINDGANNKFSTIVPYTGGVRQQKYVRERGRVNEWTFSLAGNYREKLMLGATMGIPSIRYSINSTYTESVDAANNAPNPFGFNSFSYDQNLDITGVGINLKLGAIYKLNSNLRFGAALHSPSYYALSETYTPRLFSSVGGNGYEVSVANNLTTANQFSYGMATPWRGILSASYIVKGRGFITADLDYADYSFMSFIYPISDGNGNNYNNVENAMNSALASRYQSSIGFRVGGEMLLTKEFMARIGTGYYTSPYSPAAGVSGDRLDFGGGLGFRTQYFFADMAVTVSQWQYSNMPYTYNTAFLNSTTIKPVPPTATTDFATANIAFTIGTKF